MKSINYFFGNWFINIKQLQPKQTVKQFLKIRNQGSFDAIVSNPEFMTEFMVNMHSNPDAMHMMQGNKMMHDG
jgi:tRNA1(Val) A37 N6-methylase TrmN6